MLTRSTFPEAVAYGIAAIALAYFFIKGRIIGYYPDEEALLYGAGLIGVVAALAALGLSRARRTREAAEHDRAKGIE